MLSQKRILVCPLDWGLGHATRCIPIVRLLLNKNAVVIIAADGRSLALLKLEFPKLEFITLKGYDISYPTMGSMILKMFFSIPKILFGIWNEHEKLKKIIQKNKIDIVISDNRFGLWNKNIKSIFITHQLFIKSPLAEKLLHRINLFFINKFDECWVPDVAGAINLSADLSHSYQLPNNTFFVGFLSRFNLDVNKINSKYDILALISGPEPQRSIFEKLLVAQIHKSNLKALIVCGKTDIEQCIEQIGNITIVAYLQSQELERSFLESNLVIARSGYSTIMDLAILNKKAIFIPTPGQTEQEYLAIELMQKNIAFSQTQASFNLMVALEIAKKYTGFSGFENNTELKNRVNKL